MQNRLPIVVIVLVVAVVAAVLWMQPPSAAAAPLLTWSLGNDGAHVVQFAAAKADQPVRLRMMAREPLHLYVASFSQTDGTLALFPSPMLSSDLDNPVPTGEHVLPGRLDDKPLHWPVRGAVPGATDYVVVASREPIAELAAALAHCRYFSNTTFPDHSLVFTNPKDVKADAVLGKAKLPHALLLAAQQLTTTNPNGPMVKFGGQDGVWLATFKLAPVTGQ